MTDKQKTIINCLFTKFFTIIIKIHRVKKTKAINSL